MMYTKTTLLLMVLATTMIFSCKKEKEPTAEEIVKDKIEIVIPQEYIDTLESLGMTVFTGTNPPNIEGIYHFDNLVLIQSNIAEDEPGKVFAVGKVKFTNQINDDFSIIAEEKYSISTGFSDNTIITGEGNNFTVWGNFDSEAGEDKAKFAQIYSGTISEEGITNLRFGLINVDYSVNVSGAFILEGQGRVIRDSNELCPRSETFELRLAQNVVNKMAKSLKAPSNK